MQTFIADIIPKLQSFSKKLDDLTLLTNQHWVVLDELAKAKNVYIFRSNNELLISSNGKVEKGKWEYLGNNSLLIDRQDESFLFKHGFFDENVMALKIDGKEEYALLVNENRFDGELNSKEKVLEFLSNRYLNLVTNTPIEKKQEDIISISKSQKRLNEDQNAERILNYIAYFVAFFIVAMIFVSVISYQNTH
jgi:hypothetical protein